MGLNLVALVKLNLVSTTSQSFSPLVGGLMVPFLVKLLMSLRFVRGAYGDVVYAGRLFFFQLGRITSETEVGNPGNGSRWERAVRLVHGRLTRAASSPAQTLQDEESLHTLSMLAL